MLSESGWALSALGTPVVHYGSSQRSAQEGRHLNMVPVVVIARGGWGGITGGQRLGARDGWAKDQMGVLSNANLNHYDKEVTAAIGAKQYGSA